MQKNDGSTYTYSNKNHRKQIQEIRVDIIKHILSLLVFALAIPSLVVVWSVEQKLHGDGLTVEKIILVYLSWASIVLGIVSGCTFLSLAPRWILWRKHERILNVSYTLCPTFLLLGTVFIVTLYLYELPRQLLNVTP